LNDLADPNSSETLAGQSMCIADPPTPLQQIGSFPRTPGPLGVADVADPNPPIGPPAPPLPHVRMAILNLPNVLRLLRSAAMARSMAQHTQAKWLEYNDSTFINAVYTVFFWKEKPGSVEVDTGKREDVHRDYERFYGQYRETFFDKLINGSAGFFNFLDQVDQTRRFSLDHVQSVIRDAQKINQDVIAETTFFIRTVSTVKLAADLVVKVGAPPYISIPYSMACSIIKDYHAAKDANVIAFDSGLEPAKEAGKTLAEKGAERAAGAATQLERAIQVADKEIADVTARLNIKSNLTKRLRKLTSKLNAAEAEKALAANKVVASNAARWGLKGIAFGFVAWDVKESVEEFAENIK
jgi:hypothetical protein